MPKQTIDEIMEALVAIDADAKVLRADITLDCRESDLDSALYKKLKPVMELRFEDLESSRDVCLEESVIGRIDEKYVVALAPFANSETSPLADGTVHVYLLSAKGGMRKPEIVVSILIAVNPKVDMVKSRLTVSKDGTFKPKAKTINAEIEERKRLAAEAAEVIAAQKRALNKPAPVHVREEDVELINSMAEQFPLIKEVGGGNSMTPETRKAIETLEPGDPVTLEPSAEIPEYSKAFERLMYGAYSIKLEKTPFISFGDHKRVGYIAPVYGDLEPAEALNAICQLAPYIQASVQEMIPVAQRAKNAKSPKLTIRFDLDKENLIFP